MTKIITIATLLSVLAAYLIYPQFADAPSDLSDGRIQAGHAPDLESPTAARWYEPRQDVVADDDTEIVFGIRVRKDRNCTVELKDYVTPDGEMFSAHSCTPHNPGPPHPYAHYDDDTLAAMAYADATAAALLGQRLVRTDTRMSYQLLIRASALDGGDLEHIAWLSDQAFGVTAINGAPQVANMKRQYELAALVTRLGEPSHKSTYLRNELMKVGVDARQLDSLDARVEELFQSMRDIQRTVYGEVTIGELNDA
ncbi:MAG: hypothetical protein OEU90_11475 [Gammaproteobacteria bacterium]|nr:hypothetical protein [Gammaproteobacteria bacterium]MDH3806074.1 hypothetical protein [Gammaproteobacteria bacterium]